MKNTSVLKIFMAATLFSTILFVAVLFVGYLRDDIESPAADEHSVPAVETY